MHAREYSLPGRYRSVGRLGSTAGFEPIVALDADTGKHVVLAWVPARRAALLEPARGERHLHLAAVLEVLEAPSSGGAWAGERAAGQALVVAEFVPGRTLAGLLRRGRVHPFKAVAWVLRLVDAVKTLHQRGSLHGAISPYSIVVEPVGRAIAPVLAQLVCPAVVPFCSPERRDGAGPSRSDDVWALYATLYTALTGEPPRVTDGTDSLRTVQPLREFGVEEPGLEQLLERGLCSDPGQRARDLELLAEALDAWERGREPQATVCVPSPAPGEEPPGCDHDDLMVRIEALASSPEVLEVPGPETVPQAGVSLPVVAAAPAGTAVHPVEPRARPEPRPRAVRLPLLLGASGAILVGLGAYLFSGAQSGTPETGAVGTLPARSVLNLSSAASAETRMATPQGRLRACVASYFPATTVGNQPDLGFLCKDEDLRTVAASLFGVIAGGELVDERLSGGTRHAAPLVVRPAGEWDLGWYELAATVIVRTSCCKDPAPPRLPRTSGWCEQLEAEVRSIAEATRKSGDLAPYVRRFEDAIACLYATRTRRPYRYEKPPSDSERKAFQKFLKQAAETEVLRARMPGLR